MAAARSQYWAYNMVLPLIFQLASLVLTFFGAELVAQDGGHVGQLLGGESAVAGLVKRSAGC